MNYEIGYVLYQLGRKDEAERIFDEQVQLLKSKAEHESHYAYLYLARILAFKGEKKEAKPQAGP